MEMTYDKSCDCLYIKFNSEQVVETDRDDQSGVIIDHAENGKIIGLEILNASTIVTDPTTVSVSLL